MPATPPSHAEAIGQQYDLFQASLESLRKQQKYLNYGYTRSWRDTYEERQERLCLEVFAAADIKAHHRLIDVGFGSGEQDFLLARTHAFGHLTGFNMSARQVQYASNRAAEEKLDDRLIFRHGEAEELPGVPDASVDRLLAIECAFYFDRPRFYRRVSEVLKPGGQAVVADISLSDRLESLTRRRDDFRRFGTRTGNRAEWEKHFVTKSVRDIGPQTWPGAQLTVLKILRVVPFARFTGTQVREWTKMAYYSQLVAWGLMTKLCCYDLIVIEKPA